ncbi:ATP-dependent RNA helicase HrpA [Agromyces seonyuensis]|uniref:ATP-dependent RNA helicase HrpA n=1 Tax=Agromyces seonyuensis TaxID=2662446 RepID=A0A6I4P2M6_9MICO|nr:ATP-dependent RNA helicase HrpA [Agromyces seonyuensis]MWB97464.1 ATP-dependent RNA helicase HrpA [Agromyces seonyuensis]
MPANVDEIVFPPELPVSAQRGEITDAIRDHQVVIVAGATGSGKTTQLPKICLTLGRTSIGHTQPRRLAARTIAERIAEELGSEVGDRVGYQVRFTDKASASTEIKVMTDGILLNEIHRDRLLRKYDTIIVDEAHERSLNIDFLLGYLKTLLPKRPDLKIIVTSATIDPERFAAHFAEPDGTPAPIIEVSGRTYPVEVRYRPLTGDDAEGATSDDVDPGTDDDRDAITGILGALDELDREASGDVLVFLSGEQEIRDAEDAVRGHYSGRSAGYGTTEVLPLYGRLSSADQHRVFEPTSVVGLRRRIVLATNVAETSLTVPGIKYVVDAGTARISRYSARAKVQRLPIEAISQASANQRSGRAGRTSDGIAIRLYSEEDFERRPEYTDPEILRTNLAAVILQMASLDLGEVTAFPFLTPPDPRGVTDGLGLLGELGAIEVGDETAARSRAPRLTRIGTQLSRLPIEPRFGRMVIESKTQGVSREVLAIVAGLTIQDPRERPLERRGEADAMHARFADPTSDFLTLLNLWNHLEVKQRELGSSAFRRMCKQEFLNYLRVREWHDLFRQLVGLSKPLGLKLLPAPADGGATAAPDAVHRALLSGLLSQIGLRDDRVSGEPKAQPKNRGERQRAGREYLGARGTRFQVFPGSTLAKKPPQAVMSAELVETSRLFARMNASIDPAWAEPLAGDLVKRSYSEPRWDARAGSAVADEKVLLFGVPIVPKRRLQLARVNEPLARELFIRHALVQREWDPSKLDQRVFGFARKNTALLGELASIEERTRRRDLLLGDETVFAFYDARVPADVSTTRGFERWWRGAARATPDLLTMTRADLVPDEAEEDRTAYPAEWRQGDQRLRLEYRFEPGHPDDGVSVVVPLVLLPRLEPGGFDWQVPGLRAELVTALLRALPKVIRRSVVPAAEWADKLVAELPAEPDATRPFTATLAHLIRKLTYTPVDASDFDLERVPAHLRMHFRAVDERGKRVGGDDDLRALQAALAGRSTEAVARSLTEPGGSGGRGARGRGPQPGAPASAVGPSIPERSGVTAWEWDRIPEYVDARQAGNLIRAYPAIVDDGASVSLRLLATPADRDAATPRGIRRLLALATPSPTSYVQEHLTNQEKLALGASPYPSTKALLDDVLLAAIDAELRRLHPDGLLATRVEFDAVRDAVSQTVMDAVYAGVAQTAAVLTAARAAEKAITKASSIQLMAPLADARAQIAGLVFPGFVSAVGLERLRHLARYLQAIERRVGRLVDNPGRDRARLVEVEQATKLFTDAGGVIPLPQDAPERLVRVRWLLEELRVSLFAQELGTAETVSLPRIRKALS